MKCIVKKMMALALGLVFVAAGCSKDDDNKDDFAKDIAGTYVGTLTMGEEVLAEDANITITRVDATNVLIGLNETIVVSTAPIPLNVSCASTVTKTGNNYVIAGTDEVEIPAMGTFPVSIAGTIDNAGNAGFLITVTEVPVFVALLVQFEGTKQ
ncbi:MAG: hypothetical protein LBS12_05285 [Prevotellaceae bacterium]|jgi:hypothetical protein|nr:hypothetical protein [Prevotellaceae bacterium]